MTKYGNVSIKRDMIIAAIIAFTIAMIVVTLGPKWAESQAQQEAEAYRTHECYKFRDNKVSDLPAKCVEFFDRKD